MPQLELYSANVCPFAHRTRLTLLEKGVDFQLNEIDLSNKPDNFGEISPYEKVPVLTLHALKERGFLVQRISVS